MKAFITSKAGAVLSILILSACATGTDVKLSEGSGFLRDYSSLTETKDAQGKPIRVWVSPKLTPANYDAVLIDPIVYYPEPRPSEQVSAATLKEILAYSDNVFKGRINQQFKVVDRAGPRVLQIRAALTGLAARDEGLKPYQYVPIAFVATMAKRGAAGAPQQAFIVFEIEATDSVTGELLGERVRVGTGERLATVADQKVITLDTVKPLVEELAGVVFPELSKFVKPK